MRLDKLSFGFQEQLFQSGSITKVGDIQVLAGFVMNSLSMFLVFF